MNPSVWRALQAFEGVRLEAARRGIIDGRQCRLDRHTQTRLPTLIHPFYSLFQCLLC